MPKIKTPDKKQPHQSLSRAQLEKQLRASNAENKRLRQRVRNCICQPEKIPVIDALIDEITKMTMKYAEDVERQYGPEVDAE